MCKPISVIRFCSCAENLEANKHRKDIYYVWTLERVSGLNDIAMDGMLMEPSVQLDELLPEYILKELNSKNRFDFEYQPQQNDSLHIKRIHPKKRYHKKKLIGDNLNFYFLADRWHIGYPDGFTYLFETHKNGKVEILK
ncbi:hypothetical protein [uncultured Kordia sp.]|uniref:hypothetical protein n=1 Tax=uncultured Kordia sp. TaxID=507699 RepID=UPI002603AED1|nr:hypothetical protein [uncultured Kordia sp.]